MRVAVSGVSGNGTRLTVLVTFGPARAGMNPPRIAASTSRPSSQRIRKAAVVTAARPSVTRAARQLSGVLTGSDELDLLDHIIFVAGRRRDLDLVADAPADQGAAERRGIADPAHPGVGLGLAH